MSAEFARPAPSIFISYRIADTLPIADRLAAELQRTFGAEAVFFDRRTIESGEPWSSAIESGVKGASVVLVLIGTKWLTEQNEYGRRRLDVAGDWVRCEVETALINSGSVIPVLVDGAPAPPKEAFADVSSLAALSSRQAAQLRVKDWDTDFSALVERLTAPGLPRHIRHDATARPPSRFYQETHVLRFLKIAELWGDETHTDMWTLARIMATGTHQRNLEQPLLIHHISMLDNEGHRISTGSFKNPGLIGAINSLINDIPDRPSRLLLTGLADACITKDNFRRWCVEKYPLPQFWFSEQERSNFSESEEVQIRRVGKLHL